MPPGTAFANGIAVLTPAEIAEIAAEGYRRGAAETHERYRPVLSRLDGLDARDVLTVAQAAKVAGKKPSTIRYWIAEKGLRASKAGRNGYGILRAELTDFLTNPDRGAGGPPPA